MKKVFLIPFVYLLTFFIISPSVFANDSYRFYVPELPETFSYGFGLIYYQPSFFELDYAETATTSPDFNGLYHDNHLNYNAGILASFRYTFPGRGNDLFLNYSGIERHYLDATASAPGEELLRTVADTSKSLVETIFVVFTGATFVVIPDITAEITRASVDNRTDYNSFSLEFGQYFATNHLVKFRFFGGLQYANIQQRFNVRYLGSGSKTVPFIPIIPPPFPLPPNPEATGTLDVDQTVKQNSEFHGIGPFFGTELYLPLSNRIAIKSRLGAAVLSGYSEHSLRDQITVIATPTFNFVPSIEAISVPFFVPRVQSATKELNKIKVVPNLVGQIALDCNIFRSRSKSLNFEVGYRVDHYFSPLARMTGETFVDPTILRHNMDASFSGPYANFALTL